MILDTISVAVIFITVIIATIRGAVREIIGIIGIVCSVLVTVSYSEVFVELFSFKHAIVNIAISSVIVYLISFIFFAVVNGFISNWLVPITSGPMNRFFGAIVGVIKGSLLAYLLFLGIKLTYYTFSHEELEEHNNSNKLPKWVVVSRIYPFFNYLESVMDEIIPEEFYENLKDLGDDIQDSLDKDKESSDEQKKAPPRTRKGLFQKNIT